MSKELVAELYVVQRQVEDLESKVISDIAYIKRNLSELRERVKASAEHRDEKVKTALEDLRRKAEKEHREDVLEALARLENLEIREWA